MRQKDTSFDRNSDRYRSKSGYAEPSKALFIHRVEPVSYTHLGTTVKRASLHNFEYIKERDIREGDYVLVEKAGGIIPQVIGPVIEKRTGDEKEIVPPEKCPVCGGKVGKIKSRCV